LSIIPEAIPVRLRCRACASDDAADACGAAAFSAAAGRARARNQAVGNGFPSEGMEAVAPRIERIRKAGISIPLALNFGPNSGTPREGIAADYTALIERLGPLADFIVVNVSSPNTPGLRDWQSPEKMRELFAAIHEHAAKLRRPRPVLVKVSPDLERNELFRICDTAPALGVNGI